MILLQSNITVNPQDFFTWGSFTTLGGATTIVYIVCGVLQSVFNFSPKWFALILSIIVSFVGAFVKPPAIDTFAGEFNYLLAFLNGFLIYFSAAGTNQVLNNSGNARQPPGPMAATPTKRKFASNWWQ